MVGLGASINKVDMQGGGARHVSTIQHMPGLWSKYDKEVEGGGQKIKKSGQRGLWMPS